MQFPYTRRFRHSGQPWKQCRWRQSNLPISVVSSRNCSNPLASKRIEFDTVKIRIVERFPHTEELDGVSVAKPVFG